MQKLSQMQSHAGYSDRVMETETISKNGASLKSQWMSRGNFMVLKNIMLITFMSLFSLNMYCQSSKYYELKGYLTSQGYTIVSDQYADIKQGASASYTRTFYEGNTYLMLGFSDDSDVSDVDIHLYYPNGKKKKKDADSENFAMVEFSPAYTREMKVVVKNYASSTPNYESRCRIIIARK